MRILFVGDVVGRSGREVLKEQLPSLKEKLSVDAAIVNVDNAASGRGVTTPIAEEIVSYGADILTGGDHIWDQREMVSGVEKLNYILRPANMPKNTPGRGIAEFDFDGTKLTVLHLCGNVFIDKGFDNPFDTADMLLENVKPSKNNVVFVDFHAEATSEKMALAHYLDGRVSAVIGSHTHIPTADEQILPNGTAFQTDVGMTADFDSIIGVKKEAPIHNFRRLVPKERMSPAEGEATLCGTLIETNESGLAKNIAPVRVGGRLRQEIPEF